jgi:tetratricopeptide (TPR) repeat protein
VHTPFHTKPSREDYKSYLILFLIAFCARIFFLLYIDEPMLFFKYPFFAEKLANGVDIGERLVDLSPFYLYCLTFLKKVFDIDWTYVKFIQSFVGALNCLLIYAVGAQAFRKEVGFLAAFMVSVYGNLIILESTLEPTVFVLLFNLLSVYLLLRVNEAGASCRQRSLLLLLAGLFVGFSIITKPNFLLFLPLATAWLLFCADETLRFQRRLESGLLFCGAALLVVMPITVRNYVKMNDFVLVTADAGKVFFHGNGRGATALEGIVLPDEGFAEEGVDEPDYAHVLFRKTAATLSGRKLSPSESSSFWVRRTLNDILNNPVPYIKLEVKKLFYFFNDYEMHYIASVYKEYKKSLSFPFLRYGVIASLGLLGMVLGIRHFKELSLVYAAVFVYLLSGMLFVVQSRYRTPAVPYLCLFGGYAVFAIKERLVAKRLKTPTVGLILLGVFFFLTNFFYRDEIIVVDHWQQGTKIHYQMGARPLFEKGKYQDAISELDKCLAIVPDFSPAYNLRGKSLALLGKHSESLVNFKRVISLSPNLPEGYKNAGFLYLLQGDTETARHYLSKALTLEPQDTKVRETLAKLK